MTNLNGLTLGADEDEDEIVVEIGDLREVLKLLPNLRLVNDGGRGNLLFEESTDLGEAIV